LPAPDRQNQGGLAMNNKIVARMAIKIATMAGVAVSASR